MILTYLFSHNEVILLEKTSGEEPLKLTSWCQVNKLSINYSQSKSMVFNPRQKRKNLDIKLEISNCAIERVKDTIFLGVIVDESLTWKPQYVNDARKISKSIGIIYRSSFCLPDTSLRTLYYTLVYLYLVYCVSIWHRLIPQTWNVLLYFRKKSSRTFCKKPFDAHTDPILVVTRIFANIEVPWYVFVSSWKFFLFLWQIKLFINSNTFYLNFLHGQI